MTPSTVYVDARALQDPDYRFRGVGQHSTCLLQALRRHKWEGQRPRMVALTEVSRDKLHADHRRLFDAVSTSPRPDFQTPGPAWFLCLSPMTHDPVWTSAFLSDPAIYRIALFYDMIPLDFPERYLSAPANRLAYLIGLLWLKKYDAFASISRFSGDALIQRTPVPDRQVFVSGVAVRETLQPPASEKPLARKDRQWVVMAGGGDPRKNPECAVVAHARAKTLARDNIGLVVFGNYGKDVRDRLHMVYRENGGRPEMLRFFDHLDDEGLRQVYRQGLLTVVASRAEGFSIPIVESAAAGTPVLASDVGAHPELARDKAWRFDPDDPSQLAGLMDKLNTDENTWRGLQAKQADLWKDYTVEAVGERFVEGVLARTPPPKSPAVKRGAKPSIAVLGPLPPAKSGVADYTSVTLDPLKRIADLHMFTPTPGAVWEEGWASLSPMEAAEFRARHCDFTISVMGNSDYHFKVFDYLMKHGGACIAHDARQLAFYYVKIGPEKAAALAASELGRPVSVDEIHHWMPNEDKLETLFLSEIAAASEPLFIHSPVTGEMIENLYDKKPVVLPFAQYTPLPAGALTPASRKAARDRLGLDDKTISITTFGHVAENKAPQDLIWAAYFLKRWGVNAIMHFCGGVDPVTLGRMQQIADELEVSDRIVTFDNSVSAATYKDYLLGTDIAVQLRTYFMGGLSGALSDCIGAAIPSIANRHLAKAMQAPDFVRVVPDGPSAILIAEAVLEIIASGEHRKRPLARARAHDAKRSPEVYCSALLQGLGLDIRLDAKS